jgi:thiol-disulfide isomerase/thioredoxin
MKMPFKFLAVLMPFAAALSAGADETFRTLQASGNTYTNVTVTVVTATDIYFSYDGGMGNAKIKNLSPELQKHFNYNVTKAAAQEKEQALANAQYQVHVSQPPVGRPPDESREPAGESSEPASWGTDLLAALNQARSGNKLVLMDFTGSDWCPWCIKLDHDVFSTSQFAAYAQSKLELVKVDFLRNTPQSDDVKQANAALASRYNVNGYPTCILLDSSGKELGRQVGYAPGGPDAFIAELDGFSRK